MNRLAAMGRWATRGANKTTNIHRFTRISFPSPIPLSLCRPFSSSPPSSSLFRSPVVDPYSEPHDEPTHSLLENAIIISPPKPQATLIWLHATGESLANLKLLFHASPSPHIRFLLPRAPKLAVTSLDEEEVRTWFDIKEPAFKLMMEEDAEGLEAMKEKIHALIDSEAKNAPSNTIFLGGFGQGGAMALYAGLRYPQALGGIISYSGYFPLAGVHGPSADAASVSSPISNTLHRVLAIHGKGDKVIPSTFAKSTYDIMKYIYKQVQAGLDGDAGQSKSPASSVGGPSLIEVREEFALGHEQTTQNMLNIQDWIKQQINKNKQK